LFTGHVLGSAIWLRGYKPRAVDCSRLAPLCGSFLPG